MVFSIWKVHRNCWPLCRRCFLWLHIIYSFHVNLWVSGICTMYNVDSAKLICRLGTYELKVVSKSHSNFLYPKHGRFIKASPGPPRLVSPPRSGSCLDFGFQYALIRNNWSKKFGVEYWALSGSNSPWRPWIKNATEEKNHCSKSGTPRRIWARQGPIFYPNFFYRLFLIRGHLQTTFTRGGG